MDDVEDLPKPQELLAARGAAASLFGTLRRWFDVPSAVTIDLAEVDSAVEELGDPQYVVAMAMRKLQALHLLTTPGVVTSTDVVLTVIQDLERALLQAPAMYLRRAASTTDWDAALVELEEGADGTTEDDEFAVFRRHHAALHEAARAVLRASEGEIRRLI